MTNPLDLHCSFCNEEPTTVEYFATGWIFGWFGHSHYFGCLVTFPIGAPTCPSCQAKHVIDDATACGVKIWTLRPGHEVYLLSSRN